MSGRRASFFVGINIVGVGKREGRERILGPTALHPPPLAPTLFLTTENPIFSKLIYVYQLYEYFHETDTCFENDVLVFRVGKHFSHFFLSIKTTIPRLSPANTRGDCPRLLKNSDF